MKTPQVPPLPGMTPLGLNVNKAEAAIQSSIQFLQTYKSKFEKIKAEFLAAASNDPEETINWSSASVISAQYKFVEASKLLTAWENLPEDQRTLEKYSELLGIARAELESKLLDNRFAARSTSPWLNAVEGVKADACVSLLRGISFLQNEIEGVRK